MYESLNEFQAAAKACGPDYYTDASLTQDKLEAAFRIYRNASAGTKLTDFEGNPVDFGITIVGRLALRAEDGTWVSADESFPSIDEIMRENLKVMDEDSDGSGSILSAGLWSLLANDAWVLGGIGASLLAAVIAWYWPEDRRVPRVLGIVAYVVWGLIAGLAAWRKLMQRERNPIWEPTQR